ncbi:MAG: hypothetical protein ACLRFK_02295 [Alphaproteobacteria bacterium]
MTKKIIISLFIIFASVASYAATKCIALSPSTICNDAYGKDGLNAEAGQSDWGSNCGDIYVHGVALCGKNPNQATGWVTDSVSMDGDVSKNTACFCKIVQPVVSRWVFAENRTTAGDCAYWCQNACAGKLNDTSNNTDNKNFHNAILGELFE